MNLVSSHTSCSCHGSLAAHFHQTDNSLFPTAVKRLVKSYATTKNDTDYAFEMAASNIRYGPNATQEVGMDLKNLHVKKVMVLTDPKIAKLRPALAVMESLTRNGIPHVVYDKVRVEPTDTSFKQAIEFARANHVDSFVAVGGGSVMDTAKAANLYSCYPDADFLDFVNAPTGKGRPVDKPLKPLIAVPTTAGTGSETTGTAIFDYEPMETKTGIAHRALKPLLGIVDPLNTRSMPREVKVASGLDVLCHALESYTAIPYHQRSPRPTNPLLRPAYQGSNPISDIWSMHALRMTVKYLPRAFKNPDDIEAQDQMLLAATYAGIGFGNAGVHLCHGTSYPVSGNVKTYKHPGYPSEFPLVPHGISVAVMAPAVFEYTGNACPDRHLEAAEVFGADVSRTKNEDAGHLLADKLREFLKNLEVPDGIKALGYTYADIPKMVEGTLPQHRVTKLAPLSTGKEALAKIFERSLVNY